MGNGDGRKVKVDEQGYENSILLKSKLRRKRITDVNLEKGHRTLRNTKVNTVIVGRPESRRSDKVGFVRV